MKSAASKIVPLLKTTETALSRTAETATKALGTAFSGANPGQRLQTSAMSSSALPMTATPATHRRYSTESGGPGSNSPLSGLQGTRFASTTQTQKHRELKILPPLNAPRFEDNFKDFFNLIRQYPGMEDAKCVGGHATSSPNMTGIINEGFNCKRSGDNWSGYSKYGPGVYVAHIPSYLIKFAIDAAGENSDMKDALRIGIVVRKGSEEGEWDVDAAISLPTLTDDYETDPARDEIIGKWVPQEKLSRDDADYMMVPLPAFSKSDSANIEAWLKEGFQKAGFTL